MEFNGYKIDDLTLEESDPRDYKLSDIVDKYIDYSDIEVPKDFKLEYKDYYRILNQGRVGSCKAHGVSMYKTFIDGNSFEDRYSVGWLYGNRSDNDYQGDGLVTRQFFKHCIKEGFVLNKDFDYNLEVPSIYWKINSVGKDKLLQLASKHKSTSYFRVDTDEVKGYIYKEKKPVILDLNVYENFFNDKNGHIPMPTGYKKGGHTVLCIGWQGDELVFVNSYGEEWGDNGLGYVQYNCDTVRDIWAFEDVLNPIKPKKFEGEWIKEIEESPAGTSIKWKYMKADGTYCNNEWLQIKNDWFYFKGQYALSNNWIQWKGKWYYFDNNCYMKTNYWCLWKNKYYYLGSDGAMLTNCITPDGYKVGNDGAWIK